MKKWTKSEESFLDGHIFEDTREVAVLFTEKFGLGRSIDSIRNKIKRMRSTASLSSQEDILETDSPLALMDPAIAKQQASMWLRAIDSEFSNYKLPIIKSRKSKAKTLVIVISDVHWGKKTSTYNMDVASSRILSIPDRINEDMSFDIDEIRVLLLGDLVEGEDIFPHQSSLIEAPVIEAHKQGTETLWAMCLRLRSLFGVPVIVETVDGNHGRMSKTANPKSNWDRAIHQSLAMISQYTKTPGITINVHSEEFATVDIKGTKLLLNHEQIKHLGTPAMQIKFAGWIISKNIDLLVGGHWHNYSIDTYLGRTRISNGSACGGGDDLSEKIAREDPACQAYFFIDPAQKGRACFFNYTQW